MLIIFFFFYLIENCVEDGEFLELSSSFIRNIIPDRNTRLEFIKKITEYKSKLRQTVPEPSNNTFDNLLYLNPLFKSLMIAKIMKILCTMIHFALQMLHAYNIYYNYFFTTHCHFHIIK